MWTVNELCTMNQIGWGGQVCMGAFLGILTLLDIMYRKIPVWLLIGGGAVISTVWLHQGHIDLFLILAGAGVGGIFLLISFLTREAFGYADSILIMMFGISLGFWNLLQLLFYAFGLAAVFAGIQMVRHHYSRKAAFPFIPFLTAAYAGVLFLA